ncbi:MAG: alpha/beta hydrolase [Clostridia bacterium]|jgi:pimeloyl-ACP methyl ester carboxylesterase|nr:alpha/beta hydrolase [Clostridia bacterium]MBT7123039.1 alpha/beta hydrolase [Clostridia bacterium]
MRERKIRRKINFINSKQMGSFVDVRFDIVGEHKHGKQSHTFEASIHYLDKGKGVPLVLVHGIGQSLYTWFKNIDYFVGKGYRVIALDLAGFGYSSHPNIYYTVEESVIILKVFLEKLNIEKAHFVGFSTGALSVVSLAHEHPQMVDKIVLISPGGPNENYPFVMRFLTTRIGHAMMRLRFAENAIESVMREIHFDKPLVTKHTIDQYYEPFKRKRVRDTLAMTMAHFDDEKALSVLRATTNDTLVFSGENDPIHPGGMIAPYANNIPGARHLRLRNCGHVVHEEKPKRVNNEILMFFGHKGVEQ